MTRRRVGTDSAGDVTARCMLVWSGLGVKIVSGGRRLMPGLLTRMSTGCAERDTVWTVSKKKKVNNFFLLILESLKNSRAAVFFFNKKRKEKENFG